MSLLSSIKDKLSSMSLLQKLMAVLLLPITLLALIFKAKRAIDGFFEDGKRKEVDEKDKELQEKISSTSAQISRQEGLVEGLEKAKEQAVKSAETQDSVSFHNSRSKK